VPQETIIGSANKADCRVTITPSNTLQIEVATKNRELLETGIRAVATKVCSTLGIEKGAIAVEDQGALDYVIAARVEQALRIFSPKKVAPVRPSVDRTRSARDRLRRSRLYAPGNNPRLLVGIDLHDADCALLDLEDSVPPAEKAATRVLVKHLLATVQFSEEVWVRINPLDTYGRDDLAEVLLGQPHGICLPKAESAEDVREVAATMARIENELGIPEETTWIMPIVETAKGVLHCEEIAAADDRVAVVAFGAEDFTRDVGAARTQESLLFARSMIVAGAKEARVQASDTVFSNLEDEQGLIAETQLARDLGFDGKGAINPRQIAPIHAVFSPGEQEVEEATRIVAAAEEAQAQGKGAIAIGGKMIDRPVLDRARRTLKLAEMAEKGGRR